MAIGFIKKYGILIVVLFLLYLVFQPATLIGSFSDKSYSAFYSDVAEQGKQYTVYLMNFPPGTNVCCGIGSQSYIQTQVNDQPAVIQSWGDGITPGLYHVKALTSDGSSNLYKVDIDGSSFNQLGTNEVTIVYYDVNNNAFSEITFFVNVLTTENFNEGSTIDNDNDSIPDNYTSTTQESFFTIIINWFKDLLGL